MEFKTVAADSGWNDKSLQGVFLNVLSDQVKAELGRRDDNDSLDLLISLATKLGAPSNSQPCCSNLSVRTPHSAVFGLSFSRQKSLENDSG